MDVLTSLGINPIIATFVTSMVPGIEVRGGVILGIAMGLPWQEAALIGILGNIAIIPVVIIFARYVLDLIGRIGFMKGIVEKYKARVISKSKSIQKYGPIGLLLFVGIPIPGTGVWTGAILAVLMNLAMKKSIPALIGGILIATFIMVSGTMGVIRLF